MVRAGAQLWALEGLGRKKSVCGELYGIEETVPNKIHSMIGNGITCGSFNETKDRMC